MLGVIGCGRAWRQRETRRVCGGRRRGRARGGGGEIGGPPVKRVLGRETVSRELRNRNLVIGGWGGVVVLLAVAFDDETVGDSAGIVWLGPHRSG